jgi:hypothetical protein
VENLEIYFDVARDALVNAGVAVHNPEFNPDMPYSRSFSSLPLSAFAPMMKQEYCC